MKFELILQTNMLFTVLLSLLSVVLECSAGEEEKNFYNKNPYIMELTAKNFDQVVNHSNYTTLVKFYAPWCGYCQQFQPVMEQVGKKLNGVVQVAAVNCDLSINKQLCAKNGVEGFPTVSLHRPTKVDVSVPYEKRILTKEASKMVYTGERKTAPIVNFAQTGMVNYVKKISTTKKLEQVLNNPKNSQNNGRNLKLMLFSEIDKVYPTLKSIAIDWLGIADVFLMTKTRLTAIDNETSILKETHPNFHLYLQELLPSQIQDKGKDNRKLVIFDTLNDIYYEYDRNSFSKREIAKFITEKFHILPNEGPTSKRYNFIESILTNKKPSFKSHSKKKARQNRKSHSKSHDEL